ncbi:MAG: hypothetical protein JWN59_622, partial [Sphingomonas bacterium]|nr:hypothetical protein [Sphingomonas bacterium]
LIRGGFLSDEGLALLVDGAVQRLGSGQRLSVLAGGVGDRSAG